MLRLVAIVDAYNILVEVAMSDSVSGVGGGLLTSMMSTATAKQNVDVTMLKKVMDNEQAKGEAALKLIDSAGEPGRIDVHV